MARLQVFDPPMCCSTGICGPSVDLARLEQFLGDAGVEGSVQLHILDGDSGHELTDALQADLIVMPSHGQTGIAHVLIGSVAERVVRLAHCPLLVLRN